MSAEAPPTAAIPPEALTQHLFPPEDNLNTYAILDGASIPDLLEHLYADVRPDFVCLYRGELEPDMAEVAPYLVWLKPGEPFTDWLLAEGWGKHWGIFALTKADMVATRKHFRTFLMVRSPEGKQLYFRYYDPRVLRVYLPTCTAQETKLIFGPVKLYVLEAESSDDLLRFSPMADGPSREMTSLAQRWRT